MSGGRLHGGHGHDLWDDEDGFFYDVLHTPDGDAMPLRVRSLVGLIPLLAVQTLEPERARDACTASSAGCEWFVAAPSRPHRERRLHADARARRAAPARDRRRRPAAARAEGDARRARVPVALRHPRHLARFTATSRTCSTSTAPGIRSTTSRPNRRPDLFGGNSNWRGPIWFPINYLLIEALQKFHHYYGDELHGRVPDGLRPVMTLGRGRRRSSRGGCRASSCATTTAAARCSAASRRSRTIRTGAI